MEHGQSGNLAKIVLLVEGQDCADVIVSHDDIVNNVSDSRMILEDILSHMEEEFYEIVALLWADIEESDLDTGEASFIH